MCFDYLELFLNPSQLLVVERLRTDIAMIFTDAQINILYSAVLLLVQLISCKSTLYEPVVCMVQAVVISLQNLLQAHLQCNISSRIINEYDY